MHRDLNPSLYRELSNGPWEQFDPSRPPVAGMLDMQKAKVTRMEPQATGHKADQDKPRTDLLDPLALEGLAKVLTFGAKKYAAHNWRGGISYSRLIAAILRHLFGVLRGEDVDPESGLPHVDHIGACWMFLSNMMKTRPDLDDRWKNDNKK